MHIAHGFAWSGRTLHLAFERRDLVFVDEHQEIAGMGEIDLRGEERRRGDALAPLLAKHREATLSLFELVKNQPGY